VRTELIDGRWLLCGYILAKKDIKHDQVWAAADGSNHTVTISAVRDDWVCYTWSEHGKAKYHEKTAFAFQCRYCLVLPRPDIPKNLL
jgi:hypothetical protein